MKSLVLFLLGFTSLILGCKDNQKLYRDLREKISVENPGVGEIDYPSGDKNLPVAKSYAMILNAEVTRARVTGDKLSPLGVNAGHWLLNNHKRSGQIGWGLPVAWDAFGDGTENSASTVYTISSGIAVEALLNWLEVDDDTVPREKINEIVDSVLRRFVEDSAFSSRGLISYSLSDHDKKWNCFNPAMFITGQLQRFSRLTKDTAFAKKLAEVADKNVEILLQEKKKSPSGAWYWNYSVEEDIPNDMTHALYIIIGVDVYVRHNGKLANRIDLSLVHKHVEDFISKSGTERWMSWPDFKKVDSRMLRLYDFSYLLSYLVKYGQAPDLEKKINRLLSALGSYRSSSGLYYRRPGEKLIINEYNSYLLNALTDVVYVYKKAVVEKQSVAGLFYKEGRLKLQLNDNKKLPLTNLDTESHLVEYLPESAQLNVDGQTLKINYIPSYTVEKANNSLYVFGFEPFKKSIKYSKLSKTQDEWRTSSADLSLPYFNDRLIILGSLRFVFSVDNFIYIILFDRNSGQNMLARYFERNDRLFLDGEFKTISLLLNEQLGYEHQPRFLAVKDSVGNVTLASSSLHCLVQKTGGVTCKNMDPKWRVLDVAYSPIHDDFFFIVQERPKVIVAAELYRTRDLHPKYYLYSVNKGRSIYNFSEHTIPYNLQFEGAIPIVDNALRSSISKKWSVLRDLERSNNSGLMAFGFSNQDGDIAWTQTYYLSGMLDYIAVASARKMAIGDVLGRAIQQRLKIETSSLIQGLKKGTLACGYFTTDASLTIHAVQSGKILLYLKRYSKYISENDAEYVRTLHRETAALEGHIEKLQKGPLAYLYWPKGSKFRYDGTALPYNHQHLWVSGLLYDDPGGNSEIVNIATNMSQTFLRLEGFSARLQSGRWLSLNSDYWWNYWWGDGKQGWSNEEGLSENSPAYSGDRETIAISRYRTFDAIAVLLSSSWTGLDQSLLLNYLKNGVQLGELDLFLLPYLEEKRPGTLENLWISKAIVEDIIRFDSAPEMRNSFIGMRY